MSRPKHILVIRLSALGDVAMTVPVLRVLAITYPELKISLISKGFFKPLFEDIPNLEFLEADITGKHKGLGLLKLAKEAKKLKIDAVADLHNVIRSQIIGNYLRLNKIKVAKINKGRAEKKALTALENKKFHPLKTTIQRYSDVFEDLGFPIDLKNHVFPSKKYLIPKINAMLGVEPKKLIGIAPFAAHQGKAYPLELMEMLISRLNATDRYRVFLFGGGKKEVKLLEELADPFENANSVAGKLSFEEELALISNLDVMISMDSGNGHLAAMYGIPVLSIWGVTHPYAGFAPFNQPETNQLTADREKFPLIPTSIYGNKFPKGYENAISSITPETIFFKIKEILEKDL